MENIQPKKKMFSLEVRNISINNTKISLYFEMQYMPVPVFSILGFITNALNIAVFLNSKMKDITFKYMLVISISNFFYCVFMSSIMILFCDRCSLNQTYIVQYFRIIVYYYLSYSTHFFVSLCEIFVSSHRYLIIRYTTISKKFSDLSVIILLFLFSFLIHLNEIFSYKFVQTNYYSNLTLNSVFTTERNEFGLSTFGRIIFSVQAAIKLLISNVLLIAINIGIIYEFNKRIKAKIKTKHIRSSIGNGKLKFF